jgi:hypothetical protein
VTERPCRFWNDLGWRGGAAWFAAVALLVNVLLPTAFLVGAAQSSRPVAIGFCGAVPAGAVPTGQPAAPAERHCVFCLVAAVAPAPSPPAVLASVRLVKLAAGTPIAAAPRPQRQRFAAAQPRAPPAVT